MKDNEQEIDIYKTNINDLQIMLQNKTHEIKVLEVELTNSVYQAVYPIETLPSTPRRN